MANRKVACALVVLVSALAGGASILVTDAGPVPGLLPIGVAVMAALVSFYVTAKSGRWALLSLAVVSGCLGLRSAFWAGPKENPPALIASVSALTAFALAAAALTIGIALIELSASAFRSRRRRAALPDADALLR